MTIRYTPPVDSRGSWLAARRECKAMLAALEDGPSFAAYLQDDQAVVDLCGEPSSTEIGITVERIDGLLIITAFERDPVRVREE